MDVLIMSPYNIAVRNVYKQSQFLHFNIKLNKY